MEPLEASSTVASLTRNKQRQVVLLIFNHFNPIFHRGVEKFAFIGDEKLCGGRCVIKRIKMYYQLLIYSSNFNNLINFNNLNILNDLNNLNSLSNLNNID